MRKPRGEPVLSPGQTDPLLCYRGEAGTIERQEIIFFGDLFDKLRVLIDAGRVVFHDVVEFRLDFEHLLELIIGAV